MDCPSCGMKHVDALGWCNSDNCFEKRYDAAFGKQETKMTRQEAIDKIKLIYGHRYEYAEKAVAVYEALGLIKFEEEKDMRPIHRNSIYSYEAVEELLKLGYTVTRNKS